MYSKLLVPLDGSPTANLALHHAAVLARLRKRCTNQPSA
ncbi:universal stress protein [Pseudomonas putida]|nr:universal stress protein [Pseudomonas putida]MDD2057920.1 universal stress protein [Pseudomonas putida]